MNPFSKVRSAVLTLNTRTIAEPLLAAAEKTEGEVTVYPCSFPMGLPLFPAPILPSAFTGSTPKPPGSRYLSRPRVCAQIFTALFIFGAEDWNSSTKKELACLVRGSLISRIFYNFLSTSKSKLLYLKSQQRLNSLDCWDYSHERCLH